MAIIKIHILLFNTNYIADNKHFQKHLDDTGVKDDAKSLILEFLDREEEDLLLNTKEQDQGVFWLPIIIEKRLLQPYYGFRSSS